MAANLEESVSVGSISMSDMDRKTSVLRVNVQERGSKCPLYDKTWAWKVDTTPDTIASLVQFFFQFSREIDTGIIRKVVFEESARMSANSRASRSYHLGVSSIGSSGAQRSGMKRRSGANRGNKRKVQMVAVSNDKLLVALFTTPDFEKPDETVTAIMEAFTEQYTSKIEELRPDFTEAAREETPNLGFMQHFDDFADFVDAAVL